MSYNGFKNGIYIVKRPASKLGGLIDHYGIVDIGNLFQHPSSNGTSPIVYHQVATGLTIEWLQNTGSWDIVNRLSDDGVIDARQRLNVASTTPEYNLFGNNCEHFARYVVEGEKYSTQLRAAAVVTGLLALAYFALKDNEND